MSEQNGPTELQVLWVGGEKTQPIADRLELHPDVAHIEHVQFVDYAYGKIRQYPDVNTVFIDPFGLDGPEAASRFILMTRTEQPQVVFVLLATKDELLRRKSDYVPEISERLLKYYMIDPTGSKDTLDFQTDEAVKQCLLWHNESNTLRPRSGYDYDVALSFAGEDRAFAGRLADILRDHNVRVFYDTYYQPTLWGKNLYDTLSEIYSKQSRYCIMLVSQAYKDKMWTGHERAAAQARALTMRDTEYILPVKLEEVEITGLPATIGYLSGSLGESKIAELFMEKLGSTS